MTTTSQKLDTLSTTELLAGLLLHFGSKKFSEQSLYQFLKTLFSECPELEEHLMIIEGPDRRLRSEPVRRVISFFEMGKILETNDANLVDPYFQVRLSHLESIQHQLEKIHILPVYDKIFKELATRFRNFVEKEKSLV